MIRVDRKPISVNEAYTGKRYNTDKHRQFNKDVGYMLPKIKLPEPPYEIYFKFGLSNPSADWDGSIKPVQDSIATKYGFNDKLIRRCTGVDIEIVPAGKEYFEFQIDKLGTKPK